MLPKALEPVVELQLMSRCPACGEELRAPPEELREPFSCLHCGKNLRANLRLKGFFVALSFAIAACLRFAALALNPRINPQKTSKFALSLEDGMARLFCRT
jgi:hypothetical protein